MQSETTKPIDLLMLQCFVHLLVEHQIRHVIKWCVTELMTAYIHICISEYTIT